MPDVDSELMLRDLLAERAVLRGLYAYAHGLDYGPEEAFLDVFVLDGSWRRRPGRSQERVFAGRQALTQMYRDHVHAPEYFHKHVVSNPVIDVDGDTATARSYLILVAEHPDGPYIRRFSRCFDLWIRSEDGQWRLRSREAELESSSERDFPPAPWANTSAIVA
jgi:hypothetical protein